MREGREGRGRGEKGGEEERSGGEGREEDEKGNDLTMTVQDEKGEFRRI